MVRDTLSLIAEKPACRRSHGPARRWADSSGATLPITAWDDHTLGGAGTGPGGVGTGPGGVGPGGGSGPGGDGTGPGPGGGTGSGSGSGGTGWSADTTFHF